MAISAAIAFDFPVSAGVSTVTSRAIESFSSVVFL